MKLKGQGSKLKSKEQYRAANTALLAAVLTVFLHGIVFSVPAYLIYKGAKPQTLNPKPRNSAIFIDVAMLPAIQERGAESIIRETEGKKPEQGLEEPGLNGQAEKQGGEKAEKEMLTYQDMIKQKIQQARQYPADAKQKGIEGGVEMAFTIMRQGVLKNVEITAASGSQVLDEEAIATIKRASPFPEMPADFSGQEMAMKVKIIFNLE